MPQKINAKILIVDDEKPLLNALKLKLSSSNFQVDTAENGKEALELLEKSQYDIALLDLVMPIMDGFQVLEELKKKKIKTKIVITSNLGQEEDEKKAKDLGAVAYFVKSDTPLSEIVAYLQKSL